jgi:photosystem II stability/assembly factor-like uncharacterized protein
MKETILSLLLIFFFLPSTHAQWVKTNGPEGISVTSFFNEDSVLLCGTNAQGVYRSYDDGDSWTLSDAGLQNKWVECFTSDSVYIYAGLFTGGVYRSSDHGHTWLPANAGIQNQAVVCMLVVDSFLYAGTVMDGLYRSSDHGTTWVDANGGALGSSYIHSMVYQNGRLMVEADNYIFFTYDGGATWDVDQGTTAFYVIDDFFQHGDTLLALDGVVLFRSTNGGLTWSNPLIMTHSMFKFGSIGDTIYIGSPDGVYYSINYGLTWTFTPSSDLRHGARDLSGFIITKGNFLYGYQEIGVYKSQDKGTHWFQIPLSDFAVASTIDDAMIFDNGTVYTGTHTNGVYKTSNQGNTWTKIGTPNPLDTLSNEVIFDMLHVGSNVLLAGGCGTGLFRSTDNGVTWTHITDGLPPDNGTFTCVKTLAQCGPNVLAALTNGVFYSTDSGLTWHFTNLVGSQVLQAGGFAVRGNIACVGIIGFPLATGIYRSTDYGLTWDLAETILDIETMAAGGGHTMYAGELFTSYVSHDDGLTWSGMGIGAAFSILAWDEYVFVGNNEGVLFSDNFGASFVYANQGMDPAPNNVVQGLTRDSTYIYAGTYRDGVWKRPLSDFGTNVSVNVIPEEKDFVISPNPSQGLFDVTLPASAVEVRIINSSGAEVYTNKLSVINLHTRTLRVNLSTKPDGIYSISIETKQQTLSKKLMLVH